MIATDIVAKQKGDSLYASFNPAALHPLEFAPARMGRAKGK
jgi:hypothetical protein